MQRLIAALALLGALALPAAAAPIGVIAAPRGAADEIGARLSWGGFFAEAALLDRAPYDESVSLNPPGWPAWRVGHAYGFGLRFDGTTGALSLGVDFDRDGSIGARETITRTAFSAPGATSYAGHGFEALHVLADHVTTYSTSQVTGLTINGAPQPDLKPAAGTFLSLYFGDAGGGAVRDWDIAGQITFLSHGKPWGSPSWYFKFSNAVEQAAPVPVPAPAGGIAMLALSVAALAAVRRRGRRA